MAFWEGTWTDSLHGRLALRGVRTSLSRVVPFEQDLGFLGLDRLGGVLDDAVVHLPSLEARADGGLHKCRQRLHLDLRHMPPPDQPSPKKESRPPGGHLRKTDNLGSTLLENVGTGYVLSGGYFAGHLHAPACFIPQLPQPLPFQSEGPVARRALLPKPDQPLYDLSKFGFGSSGVTRMLSAGALGALRAFMRCIWQYCSQIFGGTCDRVTYFSFCLESSRSETRLFDPNLPNVPGKQKFT